MSNHHLVWQLLKRGIIVYGIILKSHLRVAKKKFPVNFTTSIRSLDLAYPEPVFGRPLSLDEHSDGIIGDKILELEKIMDMCEIILETQGLTSLKHTRVQTVARSGMESLSPTAAGIRTLRLVKGTAMALTMYGPWNFLISFWF